MHAGLEQVREYRLAGAIELGLGTRIELAQVTVGVDLDKESGQFGRKPKLKGDRRSPPLPMHSLVLY